MFVIIIHMCDRNACLCVCVCICVCVCSSGQKYGKLADHGYRDHGDRIRWVDFPPPLFAPVTAAMTAGKLLEALGTRTSVDCLNVDQFSPDTGSERTCLERDAIGRVCGWSGTTEEAYCTRDVTGKKTFTYLSLAAGLLVSTWCCITSFSPPQACWCVLDQKREANVRRENALLVRATARTCPSRKLTGRNRTPESSCNTVEVFFGFKTPRKKTR